MPRTKKRPTLTDEAFAQAAECLKALAHPVRIRMVQMLLTDRFSVGELAESCDVASNVASEHLRLMERCGFLSREREGKHTFYVVAEPHLEKLMACIEGRFGR